jgi:hypothetical protein
MTENETESEEEIVDEQPPRKKGKTNAGQAVVQVFKCIFYVR